jgi:N-sulfoglucosamine sulfohydrolase
MNGQYGLAHATNYQHTQLWVRSLPRLFNDAAYRTQLIGKHHLIPDEVYPYHVKGESSRKPAEIAEKANAVFTAGDERPFFLVIGFHDPHRKFDPSAGDRAKPTTIPAHLPDTPEAREDFANYCGAVQRLDKSLGRVLDALEESGKANDTLVIYCSDNGIPFVGAKTGLYDPGVRLPLIIRAPGKPAGVVSDAMVSWIDITPTLIEFAGLKKPEYELPGRSLLPLVGEARSEDRPVYASHTVHEIWMYYPMRMIRTRRHKLIWNLASELEFPIAGDMQASASWKSYQNAPAQTGKTVNQFLHRPRYELFDLESDPHEVRNLADDPQHAQLKDELLAKLKEMMKQTKDPWLGRPTVEDAK